MDVSPWLRSDRWLPIKLAAIQSVAVYAATRRPSDRLDLDAVAVLLLLAGPLLLAARRRAPLLVLAGNLVASALYFSLGYRFAPVVIGLAAAIISMVNQPGRHLQAWVATGAGLAGYLVLSRVVHRQDGPGMVAVVAIAAVLALVLAAGEAIRVSARRRREIERVAVSEERLRAARDLHDVLAHQVSLVTVHANLALRALDRDPERVRTSLSAIKEVSKGTMVDLRAVLAALRGDEEPPRQPAPGLAQLDELCTRSTMAGLRVEAVVVGVPLPLPTAVDLAAYRIIQEAVTNVRRHSSARTATVTLDFGADALDVEVADDGRSSQVSEGAGVAGMRERASTVGGSFEIAAKGTGGVRINARLPYRENP
ncbi:sensor histidine kinase [Dactylosporangium sp. CS-047395]|uniref:sensor histidine kinase n=1 Tax=Dactylosporangium sp. CS-047395 TaxID=3239936 RepID=UPI003D90A95B